MSERIVNSKAWGIKLGGSDDIITSSIRDTRDECLTDYARDLTDVGISLKTALEMGVECVPVSIILILAS